MNEIASKGQLRLSYLRWALFTVPAIVFLGYLSGVMAGSGSGNRWFAALTKPSFMPADEVFPVAWTVLYVLLGLAIAIILHARGANLRGLAIGLFLLQLIGNFAWSPLFFAAHKIFLSLVLIIAILVISVIVTALFFRIRKFAAVLMLPYLAWLGFATALTSEIHRLNPHPQGVVVPALRTQI